MVDRMLQKQIDTIKGSDGSQDTDIAALQAAIGEVPSGEGNDLQSQITALAARVKALEDAAADASGGEGTGGEGTGGEGAGG